MSKKKYNVRCPDCNHKVFDADYADVEIKCPVCMEYFLKKSRKKAEQKVGKYGTELQRERMAQP